MADIGKLAVCARSTAVVDHLKVALFEIIEVVHILTDYVYFICRHIAIQSQQQ